MDEGTQVVGANFGHGTPGSTTSVAGIPFVNAGIGSANPAGSAGAVNWSVTAPDGTTSKAGRDKLFYSEIQSPDSVSLEVDGLDPAKRYVVQILVGDPSDIDARNWEIDSSIGFSGNVGVPLGEYVRRQFAQGPLGGGVLGQPRAKRHIVTFGLCNQTGFNFDNLGWDNKAPSISAFQIREVAMYPYSPDTVTLQRFTELHWTGHQIVAVTDKGGVFTSRDLHAALASLVAGKKVPVAKTKAIGCMIYFESK